MGDTESTQEASAYAATAWKNKGAHKTAIKCV
jgi:hypothetical protein